VNRVSLRVGLITMMAALYALAFSTAGAGTAAAQSFGKDGIIHACYKAKGKDKGALRVVPTASGCRKLRGWRPFSWSASSGRSGQNGSQGTAGEHGQQGPQGNPGPEGKEGQQGTAGQIEKSLTETIQKQTSQIDVLTEQVTDLTDEVLVMEGDLIDLSGGLADVEGNVTDLTGGLGNLEGTVDETCDQLTTVTDQSDEILQSLLGASVGGILNAVLDIPSLPDELGTFECTS
jgi:uncharacterized protein YoxC